jgi:outer membrane protein assembly factor BamE (lipoprotein component of BamABCDE complex)
MNPPNKALVASLLCASILVTGCLVTGDHHESTTGTEVSDATFKQIKPNTTTEDWVRATLGPPTSDSHLRDGGKILKYNYSERRESSGAVFLIFGGHDEKRIDHTVFFEVHDGIVTKAWRQ